MDYLFRRTLLQSYHCFGGSICKTQQSSTILYDESQKAKDASGNEADVGDAHKEPEKEAADDAVKLEGEGCEDDVGKKHDPDAPGRHRIPAGILKVLEKEVLVALVSDTQASDLNIAQPATFIADVLAILMAGGSTDRDLRHVARLCFCSFEMRGFGSIVLAHDFTSGQYGHD